MSPIEALDFLDKISRLAPILYEPQIQRCQAVDILRSVIEPGIHLTREDNREIENDGSN